MPAWPWMRVPLLAVPNPLGRTMKYPETTLSVSEAGLARLRSGVGRHDDQVSAANEIDRLRRDLHAVILTACAQELGLATIEAASWTTA